MTDPPYWITIELETLQAVFDIAVSSMDFGSGFLETADIEILRAVAVVLGLSPWKATPADLLDMFCGREGGHEWGEWETDRRKVKYGYRECGRCGKEDRNKEMIEEQRQRYFAQREARRVSAERFPQGDT